jgi:UDP-N-acetylmuramoyl-tripeptide--D-alanyl-D-alanine ligase
VKALAIAVLAEVAQGRLNESARKLGDPDLSDPELSDRELRDRELGDQALALGFCVDSRNLQPGDVFVATRGERVDGHDYASSACESGAVAVLSERDLGQVPCIVVDDSVAALGRIAAWYRREVLTATVIALTGSSGKTTTKDLIAGLLDGVVVAAQGSFNTEIGVPLTILAADVDTDFLVLEMGMRGLGHIRYLADLADPDIALVLNVGTAHVGMLDSVADIARAKGEIIEGLGDDAVVVLNADDPQVAAMSSRTKASIVWFGESPDADVRAQDVRLDERGRPVFRLVAGDEVSDDIQLPMHGEHFVSAALAAACTAHLTGISLADIADRLRDVRIDSRWRMEVHQTSGGVTVVNDAYNANPESMRAALKALRSMAQGSRTWAVLGEMRELGDLTVSEHDAIGRLAVRLDISRLVCVGPGTKVMHLAASNEGSWGEESVWVPDTAAAIALLDNEVQPGDVVLVKASRAVGLEEIAGHLLGEREAGA